HVTLGSDEQSHLASLVRAHSTPQAFKPRHDLLYASASLSRLGIPRENPALGSTRFFPYDRAIDYYV
ncbi:MAG TPA: hypothetical protein VLQ80_07980, partial [Candidatus Saccharimonadia bacterium]|nr:hypothetical protein [Candidatus Saccharimonadia bacterium]